MWNWALVMSLYVVQRFSEYFLVKMAEMFSTSHPQEKYMPTGFSLLSQIESLKGGKLQVAFFHPAFSVGVMSSVHHARVEINLSRVRLHAASSHGLAGIHLSSTVHVSSCGSHLVALLRRSRLLILYDFERVIRKEVELEEAIVDVQLGKPHYPSMYLAFEHNRVAVATVWSLSVPIFPPI